MKMFRKSAAMMLCFAMLLSVFAFSASAAPTTIETLLSQADVYLASGNVDTAISNYTSVLSSDSRNVLATLGLARAYEEKSNIKILANNKLEILSDDVATKQNLYTLTTDDISNANKSKDYYNRVLNYTSQYNSEVYQKIAEIDWLLGNTTQATTRLNSMLNSNTSSPEAYITYAAIYSESGDFSRAKTLIDQGLQKYPNNIKLSSFNVMLYYKLGNANSAYNEFLKIMNSMDMPAYGYKFGGDVFLSLNYYSYAIECYEAALTKDNKMTITKNKCFTLQRAMNNSISAISKTTINTLPYALVLMDQGKYQEAANILEILLKTMPTGETETVRLLLSVAYKNLGQLQKAYDYALGVTQINAISTMASYYMTLLDSYFSRSGSRAVTNNVSLTKKAASLTGASQDYVLINGGAKYTNSIDVVLDAYTSTRQVSFRNSTGNWGSWIDSSNSRVTTNWQLTNGDGVKKVDVRTRFLLFNGTEGTSAEITLDTKAPLANASVTNSSTTGNVQLTVNLNASDDTGVAGFWVSHDNDNWRWFDYTSSKFIYSLGILGYTPNSLSFYVVDVAGNYTYTTALVTAGSSTTGDMSTMGIDIIGIGDTQPPTGGITLNNGAGTTTSPYITANLWYSDNSLTTGMMSFSFDGINYTSWEMFTATKSLTLSGTNGQKYVYVKFKDQSNNTSQAYMASIYLNAAASINITNINTISNTLGGTTITWNTSTPCTASINIYVIGTQSSNFQQVTTNYSTSHTANISGTTAGVTYGFVIMCTDANGNTVTSSEQRFTAQQVKDTQAPTGSIILNGGAQYTTSNVVTATINAVDNSTSQIQMSFSANGISFDAWENLTTTKQIQLTSGNGVKTVYVRFRDAAGNVSPTYSASITLNASTTTNISNFRIQGSGNNAVVVTWNTNSSSTSYVEYYTGSSSNTRTAGNGNYVTNHSVTISGLNQNTTYWIRAYSLDMYGNRSESSWQSYTTPRQNTTPPTVSFRINNGASMTNSTNLTLDITAWDSQGEAMEMCFRDNYTSFTSWQPYSSRVNWVTSSTDGTCTMYVKVRNASGYEAQAQASIVIDATGPRISNVQFVNTTTNSITVTWNTNERSTSWVSYGSSRIGQLSAGNNSMVTNHSVTLNNLSENTSYYIEVQSTDEAGNLSKSSTYTVRTNQGRDNQNPTGSISINNGASYTMSSTVRLSLTANDNVTPTSRMMMRIRDDNSGYSSWMNFSSSYNYRMSSSREGTRTIYVTFMDEAGNTREYSANITLDMTAPYINSVSEANVTNNSATIVWSTNENATSTVEYGTSSGRYTSVSGVTSVRSSDAVNSSSVQSTVVIPSSVSSSSYTRNHSVTLTGLSANTRYYYQVVSRDYAGNISVAGTYSFTTTSSGGTNPPIDNTPPRISNVQFVNTTANSITVTWNTNERATSWVSYSSNYSGQLMSGNNSMVTNHSVTLNNLSENTTYYIKVQSADEAGNLSESSTYTVQTNQGRDNQAPTGSISINNGASYTMSATVRLSLTASDNVTSTSRMMMRIRDDNNGYSSWINFSSSYNYRMSSSREGTRTIYVTFMDEAGNTREYSANITLDMTAPNINSVSAVNVTNNSATIVWSTNENATSTVEYGTSSGRYTSVSGVTSVRSSDAVNSSSVQSTVVIPSSVSSSSYTRNHSVTLTGLSANTKYYYQVVSRDYAGNISVAGTYSFTTTGGGGTNPPIDPPIDEVKNVNVASQVNGGKVIASSRLSASGVGTYPATNANDSSSSTYWQASGSPTSSKTEWLQIEFLKSYKVNTITLTFDSDGVANDFRVQYLNSRGVWVDMISVSGNTSTTWSRTFDLVETPAIRIIITKSNGSIGPRVSNIDVRYN